MTFELRDYQREAVDGLYNYWASKAGDNPLIVAPTGSGKTAIIAQIVKDAMTFSGTRVMIVTHVKELLEQGANGLLKMYPEADFGVYSAGLKQKVLDRPITFAGIQSVWERAYDIVPAPDLILIDEAHMLPKNTETRYNRFIADLKVCNPAIKVVGLTATPYRLDTGYLHKGKGAIFDGIAYDIPIDMLMEQGYLSPVISKGGLNQIDLTNVKKRGGEFIESDLATAASDPELVRKTVEEIVELSEDRKSWLVFSSGVNHAYMLKDEFEAHDIDVGVVTGSDSSAVREQTIADFKSGELKCLINVNVLTTGFDHPAVDVVALVRATASAGLYVQMVGRGTRVAEGKTDALVLDFGSNVQRLGFIDRVKPKDKSAGVGEGKAPVKQCEACQTMCFAAVLQCHVCGHEFPPPTLNHNSSSYDGAMLSGQVKAEWVDVDSVLYHRHRKEGKPDSIKVTYYAGLRSVNEWLCPDHGGYAASRYQARRSLLASGANTTDEAMDECHFWNWPSRIKIKPSTYNPKYFEVVQFDYTKVERKYETQEGPIADWGVEDIPF
ncbi:MAG TPA: DNA helicase [Rhodobacteraceae bacterium]|nr:DNA helicase [Paracoccaceae bacterium]